MFLDISFAVKHLIIFGHSQCGGINALLNQTQLKQNDFISNWVSLIDLHENSHDHDTVAKSALTLSYENCLTFPCIKDRIAKNKLIIHRWFFDIQTGEISVYDEHEKKYRRLEE